MQIQLAFFHPFLEELDSVGFSQAIVANKVAFGSQKAGLLIAKVIMLIIFELQTMDWWKYKAYH